MKKLTSLLLTLTMLLSVGTAALAADAQSKSYPQKFYDVPKDYWAFSYIAELVDRGVLAGYSDGSFKPENTVTRAEFAKIMVGAAGVQTDDNSVYFTDMQGHWAIPYVNAAKDYLTAYSDNTYRPDQAAVREDVTMAMVKLKGYDVSDVDFSYLSDFTDTDSISNSIKKYVAVAVEKGLISGFEDNTFRGQATLTRAEAATLLWRAFQYGSDNKVVDTPTTDEAVTQTTVTPEPTEEPTPTPTAKPTEKPTATPKPTEKPTEKPTATPKPTEEPTPEPTEKPYKVDTIAKASGVSNSYKFTYDNDDTIYYVDGESIIGIDIESGSQDTVADLDELLIDNDEMTLSDFQVSSICWDNNNDRILFNGKYGSVNSANSVNNKYLYEIKDGEINILTDNYGYDAIIGTLNNGDYVSNGYIVNGENFKQKDRFASSYTYSFIESDNCIYYIYDKCYFYNYDFVGTNKLWSLVANYVTYAGGINEDTVVQFVLDYIQSYNFSGKKLNNIKINDIQVNDKSALDFSNMKYKVYITDDGIIFYDTNVNAFRIISEND